MAKNFNVAPFHHQDAELPASLSVPEKHYPQWLRVYARLARLGMWLGFIKFVLLLATITGLTIFVGNKSPEALKYVFPILSAIAGASVGVQRYLNRNKKDEGP